jgi:hypothetical protein
MNSLSTSEYIVRLIIISVLLLGGQPPSIAADASGRFTILGHGNISCGSMVAAYEKDDLGRVVHTTWVSGYLTAINEKAHIGKDITNGSDVEAWSMWIYNYCKSNPLDTLHKATTKLVDELRLRSRR